MIPSCDGGGVVVGRVSWWSRSIWFGRWGLRTGASGRRRSAWSMMCRALAAAAAWLSSGARLMGPDRVRGPSRFELALEGGARKAEAAYGHHMGLPAVGRGLRG